MGHRIELRSTKGWGESRWTEQAGKSDRNKKIYEWIWGVNARTGDILRQEGIKSCIYIVYIYLPNMCIPSFKNRPNLFYKSSNQFHFMIINLIQLFSNFQSNSAGPAGNPKCNILVAGNTEILATLNTEANWSGSTRQVLAGIATRQPPIIKPFILASQ